MKLMPKSVRDALRLRVAISDRDFDQLLGPSERALSSVHWTPVEVALRAAALLAPEAGSRVLDVGAGAGKMCCIGALAHGGRWVGVERERALVTAASALAGQLGIHDRATFTCGDMSAVEWKGFDSLYFYNPFESVLFGPQPAELAHRWAVFGYDIERVNDALADLPSETRVVTYHGFGGDMPAGYVLASMEVVGTGQLAMWVKQTRRRSTYRTLRRRASEG
jgi:hypothetical protein